MTLPQHIRSTALLTVLHLLVDGLCACSIFMLQGSLTGLGIAVLFVTYNVLAFMTQPLVGLWMDRRRPGPPSLWAALLLLFSGGVLATLHPLCASHAAEETLLAAVAVLLGMGNSLFHVYAGKYVTESTANDPRHLGFFVSSGALGLALGGALSSVALLVAIAAAMLAGVAAFVRPNPISCGHALQTSAYAPLSSGHTPQSSACAPQSSAHAPQTSAASAEAASAGFTEGRQMASAGLLLFMLLLVFGRSFVGNLKPANVQSIAHYAVVASVLAFTGKAAGGFLGRRFGVWPTLTATLMLSGVFLLLSGVHWAFVVPMVLSVNLTMPLTLHVANLSMPRRAGFAFGALAFVLIPGHALSLACGGHALTPLLLYPLVATIIIEALVLLAIREKRWQVLAASVAMNVLTNVPLNVAVLFVPAFRTSLPVHLALECAVVAVEALLFSLVVGDRRKAVTYALLCNVTSYLCGVVFSLIY